MNTTQTQINHLIKTLAELLSKADEVTGKQRIQAITKASKTVANLEKLGVSFNDAFDRADFINGVADRETLGLA